MRKILVLKGGGVRGIIQLEALEMFEKYFQKPLWEIFDLIVGTSVGSIIGGVMATGKLSVAQFFQLFIRYVPKIFKKRRQLIPIKPLYKREFFMEMWEAVFGASDRNLCMSECKTKFLCTAVNLCDFKNHFFKSWEMKDGCISLRDAIVRSFAAPYYFGAIKDELSNAVWFDGGSGENNTPLNIAFTESINLGWNREPVQFIVIGNGLVDFSIPFEKAKTYGNLKQLFTFMNPLKGGLARMQSTLNQIDQMKIKCKADPMINFRYYDIEIGSKYKGLDKLQFIQEYKAFGSLVAQKVERDLKKGII